MGARIQPDRAALEIAHRFLATTLSLDYMLDHPSYRPILENVARTHMKKRLRFDAKKLQANDVD